MSAYSLLSHPKLIWFRIFPSSTSSTERLVDFFGGVIELSISFLVSFLTTFFSLIIFSVFVVVSFFLEFVLSSFLIMSSGTISFRSFSFWIWLLSFSSRISKYWNATLSSESPYRATTEYSPSVLKLTPAFTGKLTENSRLESISPKKMPVVAMRIYDPDGSIVSANQIELEEDSTFSKIISFVSSISGVPKSK